jgi:hypothetical protein
MRLGWGIWIADHLFLAFIINHSSSQTLNLWKCREPKLTAAMRWKTSCQIAGLHVHHLSQRWCRHIASHSVSTGGDLRGHLVLSLIPRWQEHHMMWGTHFTDSTWASILTPSGPRCITLGKWYKCSQFVSLFANHHLYPPYCHHQGPINGCEGGNSTCEVLRKLHITPHWLGAGLHISRDAVVDAQR